MPVLNFGSLNIDYVYRVPHTVRPGETLASSSFQRFAGGKGANQSVALARAGARVAHAGRVGEDGRWLIDELAKAGVDTRLIEVGRDATGHAIIQVDEQGQNAIVLFPGENQRIDRAHAERAIALAAPGSILLLQNEINDIDRLISDGHARGVRVCFNPAPYHPDVRDFPLEKVSTLIVNEAEAEGLSGETEPAKIIPALMARLGGGELILTRGAEGAIYCAGGEPVHVLAPKVKAIDTTAAGDTFIGYYLAGRDAGLAAQSAMERACKAAAICVTRPGAIDSIPHASQVDAASS